MKRDDLKLPDFIIIGAAKSGTTTLYDYLRKHPKIFMSVPKEPAFFAIDNRFCEGWKSYASLFNDAKKGQICGEASPHYTADPFIKRSARRIFHLLPDVKLIYIMRHPVDRLYSHYQWEVRMSQRAHSALHDIRQIPLNPDGSFQESPRDSWKPWKFAPTFEKSLQLSPGFFLASSRYMEIILTYLQYFLRDRILFLFLEDLTKDPERVLRDIYRFLDLDRIPFDGPIVSNQGDDDLDKLVAYVINETSSKTRRLSQASAERFLRFMPHRLRPLTKRMLIRTPIGKRAVIAIRENATIGPISIETRRQILSQFVECNRDLEMFLERDLSHWNQ